MDTISNNTTPELALWGICKKIITVNGFFGSSFWQDFKEGWQEAVEQADAHYVPNFSEDVEDGGVLRVADPYESGLIWDDDNPLLNENCL